MSFVCALLLAIMHANEVNASKKDAMPDAIAALTKLINKAKPETPEQANRRKSSLAAHNRKMAASAGAGNLSFLILSCLVFLSK